MSGDVAVSVLTLGDRRDNNYPRGFDLSYWHGPEWTRPQTDADGRRVFL